MVSWYPFSLCYSHIFQVKSRGQKQVSKGGKNDNCRAYDNSQGNYFDLDCMNKNKSQETRDLDRPLSSSDELSNFEPKMRIYDLPDRLSIIRVKVLGSFFQLEDIQTLLIAKDSAETQLSRRVPASRRQGCICAHWQFLLAVHHFA